MYSKTDIRIGTPVFVAGRYDCCQQSLCLGAEMWLQNLKGNERSSSSGSQPWLYVRITDASLPEILFLMVRGGAVYSLF